MTVRRTALLVALVALLPLAACDSVEDIFRPSEVTFNGVTYAALGQAELDTDGEALLVSNIGTSGDDGVRVDRAQGITEADFRARPVDIPAGGRWGMQVFGEMDGVRTSLATVWNEAVDAQRHDIQFDFASSLAISTVTIEYFLGGELLYRVPGVPLLAGGGERRRAASGGESDDEPESVHVVRDGPKYVVATDYGGNGGARSASGGCTGAIVFVDFGSLPVDIPSSFCTDYVQVSPDTQLDFPDATSLEIRARTLPSFALLDGSLE